MASITKEVTEIINSFTDNIISEGVETRNMNAAKAVVMNAMGCDQAQALNYVGGVKRDVPNSKINKCAFLPAVVRMHIKHELDDTQVRAKVNQYLLYAASNTHKHEYNSDLNGLSAEEFINKFTKIASDDMEAEKEELSSKEYGSNNGYQIVRIGTFDDANEYAEYVDWCVTQDEYYYNEYTNDGFGLFYFCLKEGWDQYPSPDDASELKGENCPLDNYGLSMVAVSVNEDGSPNTITCRWNHANGGNDHIMTPKQLSELIGMSFYDAFPPRPEEEVEEQRKQYLINIQNDIDYETEEYGEYEGDNIGEGSAKFKLISNNPFRLSFESRREDFSYNERVSYVLVDENYQIVGERWFDDIESESDGLVRVLVGEKYGFIDLDGNFVIRPQYASATDFEDGLSVVGKDNLYNVIRKDGSTLFNQWYGLIMYNYQFGKFRLRLKGNTRPVLEAFADKEGNVLTPWSPKIFIGDLYEDGDRNYIMFIKDEYDESIGDWIFHMYDPYTMKHKAPWRIYDLHGFYGSKYNIRMCGDDNYQYYNVDSEGNLYGCDRDAADFDKMVKPNPYFEGSKNESNDAIGNLLREAAENLIEEAMDTNEIYAKYYQDIHPNDYTDIVLLDPTYDSQHHKMGKYTKWMLGMFRRGTFKRGDFGEAKKLLPIFDRNKNHASVKDVTKLHSMYDLYQVVKPFMDGKEVESRNAEERRIKQGAEKVYEDDEWLVIVPHTQAASCLYGKGTMWCTAADNNNMFDYYNNEGPLYINIHKPTKRKYQFHFESNQFMDAYDEDVMEQCEFNDTTVAQALRMTDGLLNFYKDKMKPVNWIQWQYFVLYNYAESPDGPFRVYASNWSGNPRQDKLFTPLLGDSLAKFTYVDKDANPISKYRFQEAWPFKKDKDVAMVKIYADDMEGVLRTFINFLKKDGTFLYPQWWKKNDLTHEITYSTMSNDLTHALDERPSKDDDPEHFVPKTETTEEVYNANELVCESGEMLLTEAMAIDDIYVKYYYDMPRAVFDMAVYAADPTYDKQNHPQKMGKYAKWLLGLFRTGNMKPGDVSEARQLLSVFDKYQNKLGMKDVTRLHSMRELYDLVKPYMEHPEDYMSNREKKHSEAEKAYEDNEWLIVIPYTENAAKMYGRGTKWCTAAENNNMFEYYNEQGLLLINIDKRNNKKYQFHFETEQFMDEEDEEIRRDYISTSIVDIIDMPAGALQWYRDNVGTFNYAVLVSDLEISRDANDPYDNEGPYIAYATDGGDYKETFVNKNGQQFTPDYFDEIEPFGDKDYTECIIHPYNYQEDANKELRIKFYRDGRHGGTWVNLNGEPVHNVDYDEEGHWYIQYIGEEEDYYESKDVVGKLLHESTMQLMEEAMSIKDIYYKYYSDIPANDYTSIVTLADPTYRLENNTKMGKYGKWLLGMYRKGTFKNGDIKEAYQLLKFFDRYKNHLSVQDVTKLHSMRELYDVVKPYMDSMEAASKSEAERRVKEDAEKVYDDNNWLIVIPHTEEASKVYGKGTKWCTAADNHNMFDYYNKSGNLYINIDKRNNKKYQFHFESGQFMDEKDREIGDTYEDSTSIAEIIDMPSEVLNWYKSILPTMNYLQISSQFLIYEENNKNTRPEGPFVAEKYADSINNYKFTYINQEGRQMIPDWFDHCDNFTEDSDSARAYVYPVNITNDDGDDAYGSIVLYITVHENGRCELPWRDEYGHQYNIVNCNENEDWYLGDDEQTLYTIGQIMYNGLSESAESSLDNLITESASIEDIYEKYYSDIPYEDYQTIVKQCDPTYSPVRPSKMGKYAKWLLGMYRRGTFKTGDASEAHSLLTIFEKYKYRVNINDVTKLHSMRELYDVVRPFMNGNIATSKSDEQRKVKEDAEKAYEDEDWIVIIPHTVEASRLYGKGTKWCTAAEESSNMFDYYNNEGPLYINIRKRDGAKFQLHFGEYLQAMNAKDEPILEPIPNGMRMSEGLLMFYKERVGKNAIKLWGSICEEVENVPRGYCVVYCMERFNIIDEATMKPVSKKWYQSAITFFKYGEGRFARVGDKDAYNILDVTEHELLLDNYYAWIGTEQYGIVKLFRFDEDYTQARLYRLADGYTFPTDTWANIQAFSPEHAFISTGEGQGRMIDLPKLNPWQGRNQ